MDSIAQALNKWYCRESFKCSKADNCKQAITEDTVDLHQIKKCKIKYTHLTPSCFKEK